MGLIEFKVEDHDAVPLETVPKIDFVTFDGRVIPCESVVEDSHLRCYRSQTDSSKLRMLFRINAAEEIVLQSGSLRENGQAYRLEVELARGELTRLRNFYSLWTGAGLKSNPKLDETIAKAHAAFRTSVFSDESSGKALESLRHTHDAIRLLIRLYTRQRITFRQQRTHRFPMSIGCRLSKPPVHEEAFLEAFNSVLIKTRWSELEPTDGDYHWDELDLLVEWATQHRLAVIGGPLLDLSSDCFPAWMGPWKGDLLNLQSFTSDFVETVVSRYIGRIRHWEVVCGANRGGANELSEEHRLNLIIRAIAAAQQVDEQIQISLRVVQPWGEYLSTTENRLPPIQFVDTLRRSGAKVSEVNLDLRFGTGDLHSQFRDMLNVSQLLDHWSLLQVPINVMAALPKPSLQMAADERASITWQMQQLEDLFLMSLSKERVTGFYCLNWHNTDVEDEPLVDSSGCMHPSVSNFSALERAHWPH